MYLHGPVSIPELLKLRADSQPDGAAYRFIDYDLDPAGFTETLTWSEVYQRTRVAAAEFAAIGEPGDRVAIAAPQSLDYIIGFLGAIEAGRLAVPLPVPYPGGLDERVAAALRDCSPVAIATTSAAAADIAGYCGRSGAASPHMVEIDGLDFSADVAVERHLPPQDGVAYLQYTSGSTRSPAGVMVTHANVLANLDQITDEHSDGAHENRHLVSWLPFYHDMGLILGVLIPMVVGRPAVLMTPLAFLSKPARWIQQLASYTDTFTAAPNFALDLAARRTTDSDLDGLDLGRVLAIVLGGERVHAATMANFCERFAPFGLRESALCPSYGLAEATVHVAGSSGDRPPAVLRFGECDLVSCGDPQSCEVRIVDPETRMEMPAGEVGEIWVHGEQVAAGYWRNPELTARTFGGRLADPSPGTPAGPWLRTGDLGALVDGELLVMGRIKDLLIVDGRNHHPDDIEATIEQITNGRVAAVAIPDTTGEALVAIAEVKAQPDSPELRDIRRRVAASVRSSHGLRVNDLVLVGPGSLPITTSGKVRRSACAERYRQGEFHRLDG